MPFNRYANTVILRDPERNEPAHYATFDLIPALKTLGDVDWFGNTAPKEHVWALGDRMDKLAQKYYGDDQLWWIIAFANKISYPLGVTPGTVVRIPSEYEHVLRKLGLK